MSITGPDLTLIVPCYNEAEHLESSVESLFEVLNGSRLTYEVIFVDDQSRDDTREIIRKITAARPFCHAIFHPENRGRGGAVKSGFAAARGSVVGYVDIDLEVPALYIPSLVDQIRRHGFDIAIGHRHYLLSQTGAIHRHVLSFGYRALCRLLLGLGVKDPETGYKFFRKATTEAVVMGCESDGWFFDTEVITRASLAGLRISETPVLFRRRRDKTSTVRLIPDIRRHLVDLYRIRGRLGLSLSDRSPIYWSARLFDLVMKLLYGDGHDRVLAGVAAEIPEGSSVTDLCSGSCRLYLRHLKQRRCDYLGLDCNGHFIMAARSRGVNARLFDARTDDIPPADYVVMTSSLYHFLDSGPDIVDRMLDAARSGVIITEPVRNLASHPLPILASLAAFLTNPGTGNWRQRFDLESLEKLSRSWNGAEFRYQPGDRNALIIIRKGHARTAGAELKVGGQSP